MAEIMKKNWSQHVDLRHTAKELDLLFMDLDPSAAEPLEKEDKKEQKKTGDMLYQVDPRHIADKLKAAEKVEPKQHEMVTVFFSDIVHFTDISTSISPNKVMNMFDRLYLAFDTLAQRYQIFKVETIGDACTGVTNLLDNEEESHVKRVAQFAMEAVEKAGKILIDEDDTSRGSVRIRAGFHSGPVVCNVIGFFNPRYGLFGDTVDAASRMESTSYSQRIQCSGISAKLLDVQDPHISLKKRGKIDVQGQ